MDEEEEHEGIKDDFKVSNMKGIDTVTSTRRAVLNKNVNLKSRWICG